MLHTILVFSPLLGAIIAGLFGRAVKDRGAQLVTCGFMGVSALCSVIGMFLYVGEPATKVVLFDWMRIGTLTVEWALRVDPLSTVMMFVVSFISFWIHVYSVGYMEHDVRRARFFTKCHQAPLRRGRRSGHLFQKFVPAGAGKGRICARRARRLPIRAWRGSLVQSPQAPPLRKARR